MYEMSIRLKQTDGGMDEMSIRLKQTDDGMDEMSVTEERLQLKRGKEVQLTEENKNPREKQNGHATTSGDAPGAVFAIADAPVAVSSLPLLCSLSPLVLTVLSSLFHPNPKFI